MTEKRDLNNEVSLSSAAVNLISATIFHLNS